METIDDIFLSKTDGSTEKYDYVEGQQSKERNSQYNGSPKDFRSSILKTQHQRTKNYSKNQPQGHENDEEDKEGGRDSQDFDLFGKSTSNVFSSFEDINSIQQTTPSSGSPKHAHGFGSNVPNSGLGIFGSIADVDIESSSESRKSNNYKNWDKDEAEKEFTKADKKSSMVNGSDTSSLQNAESIQSQDKNIREMERISSSSLSNDMGANKIHGNIEKNSVKNDSQSSNSSSGSSSSVDSIYSETMKECDKIHGMFLIRKSFKAIRGVFLVKTYIWCINTLAVTFNRVSLLVSSFRCFKDARKLRKSLKITFLSGKRQLNIKNNKNYDQYGYLTPFLEKNKVFMNAKLKCDFVIKQLAKIGVAIESIPVSLSGYEDGDSDIMQNIRRYPQINPAIIEDIISVNKNLCNNGDIQFSVPIKFCLLSGFPCAGIVFGKVIATNCMRNNPKMYSDLGIKVVYKHDEDEESEFTSNDGFMLGKKERYIVKNGILTPEFFSNSNISFAVTARNYCKSAQIIANFEFPRFLPLSPPTLMLLSMREFYEQKKVSMLKPYKRQRVVPDKKNYDAFETYNMCINSRCSLPDHVVERLCDSSPTKLASILFQVRAKKSFLVFLQAALLDRQLYSICEVLSDLRRTGQIINSWKFFIEKKLEKERLSSLADDFDNTESRSNPLDGISSIVDESSPAMSIFRRRDLARSKIGKRAAGPGTAPGEDRHRSHRQQGLSQSPGRPGRETETPGFGGSLLDRSNLDVDKEGYHYPGGFGGSPEGAVGFSTSEARGNRMSEEELMTLADNFNKFRLLSLGLEGIQNAVSTGFKLPQKANYSILDSILASNHRFNRNTGPPEGTTRRGVVRDDDDSHESARTKSPDRRERNGLVLYNPRYLGK